MEKHTIRKNRLNITAKLLLPVFVIFILLCSTACNNDPIFATIENEVPLRDPSLRGSVSSLVQYDDYLYACNGKIKRKYGKDPAGSWFNVSLPSGAFRCAELVVSNGTLYGLFQDSDWKYHSLQKYDGSTWTQITLDEEISSVDKLGVTENGNIYTVTPEGAGSDNSYADSYTICTVDSSGIFAQLSGTITETPIVLSGKYIVAKTGSDGDGYVYKVESGSISKLSGKIDSIMGACTAEINGSTHLYVLTRDYIYHFNDSGTQTHHDIRSSYDGFGNPAYFSNPDYPDKPLLLIPMEEGYREALINTSTGNISGTNYPGDDDYSSTAPGDRSQYNSSVDDYTVTAIFAVTKKDYLPDGDSHAVYMSIGHYKYDGLWSYYSDTETEWNRE